MVGEEGSSAAGLPDPNTFLIPNTKNQTQTHIPKTKKPQQMLRLKIWSVKRDSNPRPSGPKPDALPSCAIHRILKAIRFTMKAYLTYSWALSKRFLIILATL